ncbi:MAG: HD domain-containing protein [Candidatus Nealsonbacteria bacterium]
MKKQIIEIAKKRYGSDFFNFHIKPVVKNALAVAEKLEEKIDLEVVEIAAYLHDIARFREPGKFGLSEDHHIVGVEMAEKLMKEHGYKESFIEKVKHCILTHRGKKGPRPETIEARIVATADAMVHFDGFLYAFKLFVENHKIFEDILEKVEQKMMRSWQKITIPQARDIIRDKYEAAMLLIKSMRSYTR